MIEAFKRRIFTKRALLAFVIACFAWGELSTAGPNLWSHLQFYRNSTPVQAQVVDVRQSEVDELYEILPSGAIALQGDSLYQPIVSYASPQYQMLLCVELPAARKTEYQRGEQVAIRMDNEQHLIAKECHGLFLWGGDLLRLALGLISAAFALFLLKRTKVVRSIVPSLAPTLAEAVIPAKKRRSPRKKSTSTTTKAAAAKKRSPRKKKASE